MFENMPWFIVQKILSFLNYDDLCNMKQACQRNETLNEYFEKSNFKYQFACPICIIERPFKKIGFNHSECSAEKLRKWINVTDGNFFVQLKNLSNGNGNWTSQKDEHGWYLTRKYKYLFKEIHINQDYCSNFCYDLIKCINNPRCTTKKDKKIVRDLAEIFCPDGIKIYKAHELKQHLLGHFKTDFSLPCIRTVHDLEKKVCNEYINSSTRTIKKCFFNEYEDDIRIFYQPYFEAFDISEFESDLNRLVLCRYLNNQQKYLRDYDFKNGFFKFQQVLEIHSIALRILRDLRFSNSPSEIICNQMKYFEILDLLLPAACHNLFS